MLNYLKELLVYENKILFYSPKLLDIIKTLKCLFIYIYRCWTNQEMLDYAK
jgi:hypothetical protein